MSTNDEVKLLFVECRPVNRYT